MELSKNEEKFRADVREGIDAILMGAAEEFLAEVLHDDTVRKCFARFFDFVVDELADDAVLAHISAVTCQREMDEETEAREGAFEEGEEEYDDDWDEDDFVLAAKVAALQIPQSGLGYSFNSKREYHAALRAAGLI